MNLPGISKGESERGSTMFPHSFAYEVAQSIIEELRDVCEKIEIAGSIRRNKPCVNDVDIIAIPRCSEERDDSLFGEPQMQNLLERKLAYLCMNRLLSLEANGPKIKRFIKTVDGDDVPIDLYIASKQSWWTHLLIRTGSKTHNIKLARRAQDLHMQLKADGSGLLTPGGDVVQLENEEHVFRLLGLAYRTPEERE